MRRLTKLLRKLRLTPYKSQFNPHKQLHIKEKKSMQRSLRLLGCLAIIALPMIALPVHAETGNPPPPTKDSGGHDQWREGRHEDHEEMQEMRTEREQLESQRDSLKARCMDAKGQD